MKNRTFKAVRWSLIDTYAGFALKFVFTIAITRILTPHDYGIVAYMGLFLGIANWFSSGGFNVALIQKRDPSQVDFSTAWIFNMGMALLFFLAYYLIADYVAVFFKEPALKWVMRVTSLNLLLNSACNMHLTKLIKDVNFKPQALINFLSSFASGVIALVMAIQGFGYWALIVMTLAGTFLRMLGILVVVKWKPSLIFCVRSFREQFHFGVNVFLQGLMDSIFREVYSLVIGKNYNTQNLGLYSRGQRFYDLFIVNTGIAVNKVLFPLMAKKNDDPLDHAASYFRFYNLLFFIMAPLSLCFILLSRPLVLFLLTEKWLGAVPYMRLYFFAGFTYMLVYFNTVVVLSLNKPRMYLLMDIGQKALFILALFFTYRISIKAIIIGWLAMNFLYFLAYEFVMHKNGLASRKKYFAMGEVLVSLAPILGTFHLLQVLVHDTGIVFLLQLLLMPLAYLLFGRLCRFSSYKSFSQIIGDKLPKGLHWLT